MKKTLSIILALTLALSLAVTALADDRDEIVANVTELTDSYWWTGETYDVYSSAEMDIGNWDLFQLYSSKGIDKLIRLTREVVWGANASSQDLNLIIEVPAGTDLGLYTGDPEGMSGLQPGVDFSLRRVNCDSSTGKVTDVTPATVYNLRDGEKAPQTGNLYITLNEPGYYQVEGKTPEGYKLVILWDPVIVHVTGDAVANPAAGATTATPTAGASYAVVKGDTLMKIAKKAYGDSKYWSYIYEANSKNLKATNELSVGQVLVIPVIPAAAPAEKPAETPAEKPATAATPTAGASYTVVKGDNLSKIAKAAYGDANQWKKIFEANKDTIKDADVIDVGQVIVIPA